MRKRSSNNLHHCESFPLNSTLSGWPSELLKAALISLYHKALCHISHISQGKVKFWTSPTLNMISKHANKDIKKVSLHSDGRLQENSSL